MSTSVSGSGIQKSVPPAHPLFILNNADLFFDPDTEGIDHLMAYLE